MIRLENWAVHYNNNDGFKAPEQLDRCLSGECYGHPRKPDGLRVNTSSIVSTEGRTVTTASGSVYVLGEIHPHYAESLARDGITIDPAQPVKVLT